MTSIIFVEVHGSAPDACVAVVIDAHPPDRSKHQDILKIQYCMSNRQSDIFQTLFEIFPTCSNVIANDSRIVVYGFEKVD